MYKDLLTRQFSHADTDRSWQPDAQISQESPMLTGSLDLPTFMEGRLRMNLPVSHLANSQIVGIENQPSRGKTVLAYLGYRNGKNGDLLCLRLGLDWEDTNDFCRNSLVQVAKANIAHFRSKTIVLVSWRNMKTIPETVLRDALRYQFCLGPLPPCLSVLNDSFTGPDRPTTSNSSSFTRHFYTDFRCKDDVVLHKKTWAISVLKHEHRPLQGTVEYVEVRFGPMFNTPVCSVAVRRTDDRSRLPDEWAVNGQDARFGADRMKVLVCSGSHAVSVSVKREPNLNSSVPKFLIRIVCEATTATRSQSQVEPILSHPLPHA